MSHRLLTAGFDREMFPAGAKAMIISFDLWEGGKIFVEHLINISQDGNHLNMVLPPVAPFPKLDSAGPIVNLCGRTSPDFSGPSRTKQAFDRP